MLLVIAVLPILHLKDKTNQDRVQKDSTLTKTCNTDMSEKHYHKIVVDLSKLGVLSTSLGTRLLFIVLCSTYKHPT